MSKLKEDEEETPCPKRKDGTHCVHWWDGDQPCCACGAGTVEPESSEEGK